MTQTRKRIKRNPSQNNELISFRIPRRLREYLDKAAERDGSNRTAILLSSIALHKRLSDGMFVPMKTEVARQLLQLTEAQDRPSETIAAEALEAGIRQLFDKEKSILRFASTPTVFRGRDSSEYISRSSARATSIKFKSAQ